MANVRTIAKPGSKTARPNTTLNKAAKCAIEHMREANINTQVFGFASAILAFTHY